MNRLFIRSLSIDWKNIPKGSYLRAIPALSGTPRLDFSSPVVFFAGENGSGKSTLLEAIAVAWGFNPEGGTRNYRFSTRSSHSELWKSLRLVRGARQARGGYFLRAESFYNVATQEELYADPAHPSQRYHEKSHGEGFLALAQNQLAPNGLYLFDEPEAALSPQRQLCLMRELLDCSKTGSQFIIATHSPVLLGMPGAEILNFDGQKIAPCRYEETLSYQITELFINHRERLLSELTK